MNTTRSALATVERRWAMRNTIRFCLIPFSVSTKYAFGIGIQRGGGFIQDQHRRVPHQTAGDAEALLLTHGKCPATTAQDGLVPIRERGDEVVGAAHTRRPLQFGLGRIRSPVAQVVEDRFGEQQVFLKDIGDLIADGVGIDLTGVHAVEQDTPGGRLQEARHEVGEAGLAGAGGTDKGDDLAHAGVEGDPVERLPPIGIDQSDVVDSDAFA